METQADRMLTATHVTIDSPRRATLTHRGRQLQLDVLAPATVQLTTRHAAPPTSVENQNRGVTAIEVTMMAAEMSRDARIAALLTPIGNSWGTATAPDIVPLENWK